ncbi:trypsin eta-like [Cloeon dipterum]|uniref:trypsin eta-like n=1 Tax=Cloeon dipterum TaxID=197152 RepID=UPI00321F74BA
MRFQRNELSAGDQSPRENIQAKYMSDKTEYPEYLGVTAGSINIYEGVFHSIRGIIMHDDFDPKTGENDIALMEVHPPFDFGPNIRAASLPAIGAKDPAVGTVATIIGWGDTKSGGPSSYLLLEAQIEIRNHTMCREAYAAIKNVIFPSQICANDAAGGKGTCNGDSGGPLFVDGVLVGVASYIKDCEVARYPSVFARVSYYMDWIRSYTSL